MEPLLRLVDDVRTGFETHMKTVAGLVDLKTAFDKVQHPRLLNEMCSMGIPPVYVRWFREFLRDRRAFVRFEDTYTHHAVRFSTGVPQGTVSGPLLFIIYINPLAFKLSTLNLQVRQGIFADDITVWKTARMLSDCDAAVQQGPDLTGRWARVYKMPLSEESEAITFSNDQADIGRPSTLTLGGRVLPNKPSVRLLGVVLDTKLSFKPHVDQLVKTCTQRLGQMRAITGAEWGSEVLDLRALYLAYIRSKIMYCASVYIPLLSPSTLESLERLQRTAARIATGCVHSTPNDVLLLQCDLTPLSVEARIQAGTVAEKYRRFPDGDLMRVTTTERAYPGSRLVQRGVGWQLMSDEAIRTANLTPGRKTNQGNLSRAHAQITREPILMHSAVPPWATQSTHLVSFHSSLIRPCPTDTPNYVKKRLAEDTLQQLGEFDVELWTDGTLQMDQRTEQQVGIGGGLMFERGRQRFKTCAAAGLLPSSFRAEGTGIITSLHYLIQHVPPDRLNAKTLLICTDSISQVGALAQGPLLQTNLQNSEIWVALLQLLDMVGVTRIVFQWVPTHCGLSRNEAVDKCVGQSVDEVSEQQSRAAIPLAALKAAVKSRLRTTWLGNIVSQPPLRDHPFPKKVDLRVITHLPRADATLLLQLRAGVCREVGQLWHHLRGDTDKKCRWCKGDKESVTHLFSHCRAGSVVALKKGFGIKDVRLLGSSDEARLRVCVSFVRQALASLAFYYRR